MVLVFTSNKLEALYEEEDNSYNLSSSVVDSFFYHAAAIAAAASIEDLLQLHSLPMRTQRGDYLIDLDENWKLALSVEATPSNTILVNLLEDITESTS